MPAKSRRPEDSPDAPIKFRSWTRAIRKRAAKPAKKKLALLIERVVADPRRRTTTQVRRRKGSVELIAQTSAPVLRHVFPPSIKTVRLGPEQRQRALKPESLTGYRPEHLAVRPVPDRLPRELRVARPWRRKGKRRDDVGEPGTISLRRRYALRLDRACVVPLVHVRPSRDGQAGSGFGCDDRSAPPDDGESRDQLGTRTTRPAGSKFTPLQVRHAARRSACAWVDAHLLVAAGQRQRRRHLERSGVRLRRVRARLAAGRDRHRLDRIARIFRPLGTVARTRAHVGYPGDFGGSITRPIFHGDGVIDSTVSKSTSGRSSFRMMHRNDYWPGQSGGPAFGWWDGRAVAAGGRHLQRGELGRPGRSQCQRRRQPPPRPDQPRPRCRPIRRAAHPPHLQSLWEARQLAQCGREAMLSLSTLAFPLVSRQCCKNRAG